MVEGIAPSAIFFTGFFCSHKRIFMPFPIVLLLSFLLLFTFKKEPVPPVAEEKALAFPGAEGFGKYTTGGRGGKVLIVDNLNDSGEGSLRAAIEAEGARTVVFEVAGTIALESRLEVTHGDLTIAGQSAPGEGITIRNQPIIINADNIIIRYLRMRLGDTAGVEADAMSILRQKDIIIDHCSLSWGTDETGSFYDNEHFTLQWCIISESLNKSVHEKGEHGYGGIWGGKGASFHHNLLAHHKSRLPRFCGARYHKAPEEEIVDYRNNVIYNWGTNSAYAGEEGNHNMVANYYKPGPATEASKKGRLLEPWEPFGRFYIEDNIMEGDQAVTADNRKGVEGEYPDAIFLDAPVEVVGIPEKSAKQAYEDVLLGAGASKIRDEVDQRIIEETKNGTATFGKRQQGLIDSQSDVGGWPALKPGIALPDADRDGMPDEWENKHGLNPNDAKDASKLSKEGRYTNLEVYLNSLAE